MKRRPHAGGEMTFRTGKRICPPGNPASFPFRANCRIHCERVPRVAYGTITAHSRGRRTMIPKPGGPQPIIVERGHGPRCNLIFLEVARLVNERSRYPPKQTQHAWFDVSLVSLVSPARKGQRTEHVRQCSGSRTKGQIGPLSATADGRIGWASRRPAHTIPLRDLDKAA